MGLLDYYRQFEEQPPEEVSAELRERAAERRRQALSRVEPLDLSALTWPELPPSVVVNAVTYVARRGLHRYREPHAAELRSELAHRLGLPATRVVVGNGAAQLLGSAAQALIEPGDELVTPWPSYPLLPVLARRAGGSAVPVGAASGRPAEAIVAALTDRTRIVALCNPNDPTGEWLDEAALRALLSALPERVVVLLDEALVEYAPSSAAGLVEEFPRLLVFRSFSKAWGLAGLRIGYAVGGPDSEPLLERVEPELGVNELAQAGALEALRATDAHMARRVEAVRIERARLAGELEALGLSVAPSEANLLWLGADGFDGAGLAHELETRAKIRVAEGGRFGDPDRIRVAVQDEAAGDRLRDALAAILRG
ncbi:pyridoxal phosphate-dependent aminotransferase [Capillimicrobium parvum]|uniref:Aminotransferase n=1 Tax=Capillimicrobium parvum TaxID=2884022 RepID=A0A9E7C2Y6_9ACTN|nr:histidinol-phosphate transaminase [Capillimicrobium parvum]UGS38204.1 Putative phenylalanine aminotransferase [Capillimicrobium parvum]